jgi:hypothetical protein
MIVFQHYIVPELSMQSGTPSFGRRACSGAMDQDQKVLHIQQPQVNPVKQWLCSSPYSFRFSCKQRHLGKGFGMKPFDIAIFIRHQKCRFIQPMKSAAASLFGINKCNSI